MLDKTQMRTYLEQAGLPTKIANIIGRTAFFESRVQFFVGIITAIRIFDGVVQLHTNIVGGNSACWLQCAIPKNDNNWTLFINGTTDTGSMLLL